MAGNTRLGAILLKAILARLLAQTLSAATGVKRHISGKCLSIGPPPGGPIMDPGGDLCLFAAAALLPAAVPRYLLVTGLVMPAC
jgi:hypothetical protein